MFNESIVGTIITILFVIIVMIMMPSVLELPLWVSIMLIVLLGGTAIFACYSVIKYWINKFKK